MFRHETVMAARELWTLNDATQVNERERTLNPRINACVAGLDLGYRHRLSEHALDERWLDLDCSDDPLSVPEHCIAQRCKCRGHVQEWSADHPPWITSGVYSRPQAVCE